MSEGYFAKKNSEEIGMHLAAEWSTWKGANSSSGYDRKLSKAFNYYYGNQVGGTSANFSPSEIISAGEQGELKAFGVNHFRNVIRHILALTAAQRPTFDARAINTDLSSLQRAKLGSNIVDYYMKEKKVFKKAKDCLEQGLVLNKAFVSCKWDTSLGRGVGVEPAKDADGKNILDADGEQVEKIRKEGDVAVSVHSALDVRYDKGTRSWEDVKWVEVRELENKWDVSAQYPIQKEAIEGQSLLDELDDRYSTFQEEKMNSDYIPVYTFYHIPSSALPAGRVTKRLKSGEVLFDGPYPFGEKMNVFRFAPGEIFESTEGYSDAMDLLVLQEVLNTLESTAFTNQQAFGVQAIAVSENSNITTEDTGGMSFIKVPSPVSENMPRPVQLTATPPEIFSNIQAKERSIEKLSGVNSVVRGDPEHSLKSGAALARVQAMAIQYASNTQEGWVTLLEDIGGFMLHLLKEFAQTDRLIALSGKVNKGAMASFKGEDLANIDGVVVDLGNPVARTVAGKLEIADRLLEKGLVKTPQEYLTVMETGNLDPLIEGPEAELMLIRKENEGLMEGDDAVPLVGDSHLLHMQEHRTLLANPMVRMNGEITKTVLGHIQEHMDLYKNQDPVWAAVSGEPPAPSPPPPPMQPPQGPGPQGPPPEALGPPPGPVENAANPMASNLPPPPMPKIN